VTTPDQRRVLRGLEREDLFTIVFDQVMTDTARYADVLLPNTTFLEGYDLVKSYGPWTMGLGRPVIEPIGESRCNADVFGALLELTGLGEENDPHGEIEEMLDVLSRLPGTTGDEVRDCGAAIAPFDGRPIQFRDVFPRTADRKIDLYPDVLANESAAGLYVYQPDPGTQEYPLALISPASDRTISSTLDQGRRRGAGVQRARRRALQRGHRNLDPPRHRLAAEGALEEAHGQRLHGHLAGARHADRCGRRGVLQRRAGAGGTGQSAVGSRQSAVKTAGFSRAICRDP
jgi:anaerobic selenocysteine-containing dehydrogenase